MPDKMQQTGNADVAASEGEHTDALTTGATVSGKRARPRWQRWLMWASVRLLLVAGVGAGIGTVQMRARPPDLMAHAHRIASLAKAEGYYWTPNGELRLYEYRPEGTATLRWNQATQSTTFEELLMPGKDSFFQDPMRDVGPYVQTFAEGDKQFKIISAFNEPQHYSLSRPMPKPDYLWKIKVVPDMQTSFSSVSLSPDGKRIAYKCLVPHIEWRDAIMQRLRRGYKAPFRGQGAAILISAVDGSRTDILGVVKDDMPNKPPYSKSGTAFSLQGLFWCPDGKHLSFAYGDGVYEVPVN